MIATKAASMTWIFQYYSNITDGLQFAFEKLSRIDAPVSSEHS